MFLDFREVNELPLARAAQAAVAGPRAFAERELLDDLTYEFRIDGLASGKGGNGGGNGGGKGGGKPDKGGGGTDPGTDPGFTPDPYVSGPADASAGFNITLIFEGTWTQSMYDIFVAAADFFTTLIVGDLPDIRSTATGEEIVIDDVQITASLIDIDGTGAVLGRAGPVSVRSISQTPVRSIMEFDIADAENYDARGLFDDLVLHEMAHALGFGALWDRFGLVDENSLYTGEFAKAESLLIFGTETIIVETDGGNGTAGSHWDDSTYTNELMTGYISDPNYFSTMSAAAFADLGYELGADWRVTVENLNLA